MLNSGARSKDEALNQDAMGKQADSSSQPDAGAHHPSHPSYPAAAQFSDCFLALSEAFGDEMRFGMRVDFIPIDASRSHWNEIFDTWLRLKFDCNSPR